MSIYTHLNINNESLNLSVCVVQLKEGAVRHVQDRLNNVETQLRKDGGVLDEIRVRVMIWTTHSRYDVSE